jgi:O-antigen/teichoic acid export membrane protein
MTPEPPVSQSQQPFAAANSTRSVAKEGGWAGLFNLLGALIRYGNNLILTRILGPTQYGLFVLANTILTAVAIPSGLGLSTSIVHFLGAGLSRKEWSKVRWMVKAALTTALISSLAGVCFVIALSPWLSSLFLLMKTKQLSPAQLLFQKENLPSALKVLAPALAFLVLYTVCAGILQGLRQIRAKVFIERIAHPLLFSAMLLGGGFFFRGLLNVLLCYVVAALAVSLISALWLARKLAVIPAAGDNVSHWRELASFSTPVVFMNLLNFLVLQSDILAMGAFRGLAELAIYTIASRLAQGVSLPTDARGASLAPSFSALMGQGNVEGLRRLYHTSTRWLFLMGSFVGLALILAGKLILSLFGRDFSEGFLVLCVLASGQVFSACLGANGSLITMTGHPKVNLVNSLCLGLGNLGFGILLVPRYGAMGAAAASATSLVLVNLARALEIWLILRIGPWDRSIRKPLITLVVSALTGCALHYWANPIAGAAGGMGMFLLFWTLMGPEPEDREIVKLAIAKIRRLR